MKTNLLKFILAVLTLGLLGSCSKINERIDGLDKRVYDLENSKIASIEQQVTAINTSITDLKAADETIGGKIGDLKTTAEALQTLIDALKEADKALVQKDEALEARIATLEGQVAVINGQIKALEEADKAINARIDELKSYIDTELGKTKDWASASFATLEEYRQTAADLATLSVTVSGINTTLAAVQTSITTLDTKIDGIDAALQGKIADAKTELEGKISSLKTELEGKITEAISTSEDNLKGWVNEQLSGYYTIAEIDVIIAGLQSEIDILNASDAANKTKIAELEANLTQLTQALEEAKTTIKTEYKAAIATAISEYNGTITQTINQKIAEVNASITALTARVETLETTVGILTGRIDAAEASINTINQQIAAINQSISDLEIIRTNIQALIDAKNAMGEDITALKAADQILEGKINDLKTYVDTELAKYATTDWVNGTFATLVEQNKIIADIEQLKQDLAGLDSKLDQAIANLDSSLKGWVNEQLSGYYTIAEIDVKIAGLQSEIDILNASDAANKTKIAELETKLNNLSAELTQAKATIKTEYEAAIAAAITEYNGTITQTIQSKIDEVNATIAALTARVEVLETNVGILSGRIDAAEASIATINQQIAAINQSISDLEIIRTNIQSLIAAKTAQGEDITALKAADEALEAKIAELKTYVDTELAKYGTKEWVNATFATLAQYQSLCDEIASIKQSIGNLETGLSQLETQLTQAITDAITASETNLKAWVNTQLSAYYTKAEIEAKIAELKSQIDDVKAANQTNGEKIETLQASLDELEAALEAAKATIKEGYEDAIEEAIEDNNGIITQTIEAKISVVNTTITNLTARVETLEEQVADLWDEVNALKAMIQTVTIIPAYNDGSVKAEDGILTINCVITPKEAVENLKKENFTILTNEVQTKSALYGTLTIAKDEDLVLDKINGTATIKVDVSTVLPTETGKALTVALQVKNGISDYITEFVPVYVYVVPLPEGALKGVFSVSTTKKVHFSQGNLQATYNGSSYTWSFAASQYAYVGKAAGNTTIGSQTSGAVVDLFGWSTASTTYGISKSTFKSDYSGDFKDWGTAIDDKGTWRTLTTAEWQYLFNNHVKVWGQCNSVNGYFIAPNGFVGDASTLSSLVSDWTAAEAAGIVFLPAAGYRYGSDVLNVGDSGSGSYWSSTASDKYDACRVFFCSSYDSHGNGNRNYGYSVRLITEPGAPAPQVISVESVSLNKSTLELAVGSDETLTATVTPDNATDKNVSWSSNAESVATVDASGKVTAVAPGDATITVTTVDGGMTATCAVKVKAALPANALPGEFSVSATKKVHFSKGNLVATIDATGAPTAWKFAANQYDCIGEDGANKTIGVSGGDVDFFGWSTASTTYGISTSTSSGSYSGDFVDWGKAYCEKNSITPDNTWRTLSKDEWTYLFNTRTDAASKVGYATVGAVKGIIILPDNFTDPMKNNGNGAFVPKSSTGWNQNVYTSGDNWNAMETAGAVFLPAAGTRNGSLVFNVGIYGDYWSSTASNGSQAYHVYYSNGSVSPGYGGNRISGFSVRLITESK